MHCIGPAYIRCRNLNLALRCANRCILEGIYSISGSPTLWPSDQLRVCSYSQGVNISHKEAIAHFLYFFELLHIVRFIVGGYFKKFLVKLMIYKFSCNQQDYVNNWMNLISVHCVSICLSPEPFTPALCKMPFYMPPLLLVVSVCHDCAALPLSVNSCVLDDSRSHPFNDLSFCFYSELCSMLGCLL